MPRPDTSMTAQFEKIMEAELRKAAETVRDVMKEVRPLGSQRVPEKEQALEFTFWIEQPELFERFLQNQGATVADAIKYADKMMKLLERDQIAGIDEIKAAGESAPEIMPIEPIEGVI